MLDIFHLQQIQGDITESVKNYLEYTGHIQVAQVPSRYEPDTAGELNYDYILHMIGLLGYKDWIGLEYKPANETKAGLKWIKTFGFELE